MDNRIKSEIKTVYITSNRAHDTKESAENEIIEQTIREEMVNRHGFDHLTVSRFFIYLFENRDLIKRVLNMRINYE
jgi:hypothetical protein